MGVGTVRPPGHCQVLDLIKNYPPPPAPGTVTVCEAQGACVVLSRKHAAGIPKVCWFVVLIKTEYWDRAGGGGNIRYEW